MSTSGVATLRDLLARTPVASRLLLATGDPGGRSSVGAGGGICHLFPLRPRLRPPFRWAYSCLELVKIVAAVSLACFMSFLVPWGKLFADVA